MFKIILAYRGKTSKVKFPIIRKVKPQLIANDIVSCQPMKSYIMDGPADTTHMMKTIYISKYGEKSILFLRSFCEREDVKPRLTYAYEDIKDYGFGKRKGCCIPHGLPQHFELVSVTSC